MTRKDEQVTKPRVDSASSLRVGYIDDIDGSTRKVEIIAETTDGRYVCRRHTSEVITRWDGTQYLTQNYSPLFLKPKNEVTIEESKEASLEDAIQKAVSFILFPNGKR